MIRHILFDLDSTLYSDRYGLEDNMIVFMKQYLARYLCTTAEEAMVERYKMMGNYGTTLEWLIAEKGFTAIDDYFSCLHPESEADSLPPHPELRRFLQALPCPCSILTNSPGFHARRIIKKMGLEGIFVRVFDIESNGFKGKPHEAAFRRALDALEMKPGETLFIDDNPRYVEGFLAMGGKALLFDENDAHKDFPHGRIGDLTELTRFLN
jgi:putative hydrolase of the HAD superfamily